MIAAGKVYIVHGSASDRFRLFGFGDQHLADASCATHKVRATVADIAEDDFAFALLLGDMASYIHWTDKRYAAGCSNLTPEQLNDLGAEMHAQLTGHFDSIRGKVIGAHVGNHELHFMRQFSQGGMHKRFCDAMECANLGSTAFTDVVFVRRAGITKPFMTRDIRKARPGAENTGAQCQTFRVASCHGRSGATTTAGKLTVLRQFMGKFSADLYLMGHLHERIAWRRVQIGANQSCSDIADAVSIGAICGAYLLTYAKDKTGYGEEKLYDPVALGCSVVTIRPFPREMKAEV